MPFKWHALHVYATPGSPSISSGAAWSFSTSTMSGIGSDGLWIVYRNRRGGLFSTRRQLRRSIAPPPQFSPRSATSCRGAISGSGSRNLDAQPRELLARFGFLASIGPECRSRVSKMQLSPSEKCSNRARRPSARARYNAANFRSTVPQFRQVENALPLPPPRKRPPSVWTPRPDQEL